MHHRLAPSALLLLAIATPTRAAEASVFDHVKLTQDGEAAERSFGATAVLRGDSVHALTATVKSDAGEESVTASETDAWLHGSASLSALPTTEATLLVTLYDKGSAPIATLSGTLGTTGGVFLVMDTTDSGDCDPKKDCSPTTLDLDLLAAELYAGEKAYTLGLDLAGADTYTVAYATVSVTETGTSTCVAYDEKGGCLKWTTTATTTGAEFGWDDVGSVWTMALGSRPEGEVTVKLAARDEAGKKIETTKVKLGLPWDDGGEGLAALVLDDDPLTTIALLGDRPAGARGPRDTAGWDLEQNKKGLTIISTGWSTGDTMPVEAELHLANGDRRRVPVNSYHRTIDWRFEDGGVMDNDDWGTRGRIVVRDPDSGDAVLDASVADLHEKRVGLCCADVCLIDAGGGDWSLTAYGTDAAALPDTLIVTAELEGWPTEELALDLDTEVTAIFGHTLSLTGDPTGFGLSGDVALLGAATKKGKQKTLAQGSFSGVIARDGDGDLELAGGDSDVVVSGGSITFGDEAQLLTDEDGNPQAPPAIQYLNGSGTKNASSQVSAKPQLL